MALAPVVGDFVRVRARRWLVEDQRQAGQHLIALKLACIDDDAQGETAHIVWDAELDAERLGEEGWESVARSGTDDPDVFAGYTSLSSGASAALVRMRGRRDRGSSSRTLCWRMRLTSRGCATCSGASGHGRCSSWTRRITGAGQRLTLRD